MRSFSVFSWFVTFLAPFAIIMLAVRILLTPVFPEIEYRMPAFPNDPYGFTLEDRLRWAKPSIEYLTNGAEISYLGNLEFDNGTPIYNERELSHMHDVKLVVQSLLRNWYFALVALIGLGVWAWRGGWLADYLNGWRRGGWLTVGLLVGIGLFAAISFRQFFTLFHGLFFTGDSWIFLYYDTLIRLFPIRFWMDCVAYIAGFSLLCGLALGLRLKRYAN